MWLLFRFGNVTVSNNSPHAYNAEGGLTITHTK